MILGGFNEKKLTKYKFFKILELVSGSYGYRLFLNYINFQEKLMKKILAFAVAAVVAVAMASADPLIVGHGYFGVGLGSTVTNPDGTALYSGSESCKWEFASNLDLGVGVGLNIPFGGYFGVQPGVDFCVNNVGYSYHRATSLESTTVERTYSYLSLDVPILLTAKLNKFNFALGPYVSFVLGDNITDSNKISETVGGSSWAQDHTGDRADKVLHSWGSVGLAVGIGYEQRLGMGMLVIGGRYMLDFIPIEIQHVESGNRVTDYKFNRRELAIDVGYKIPLSF